MDKNDPNHWLNSPEGQEWLEYYEGIANFARWIVSLDDDDPNSPGRKERQTITLTKIINRAKQALDG